MKRFLSLIAGMLKFVALALSHVSLRGLVLLLGCALAFLAPRQHSLSLLDREFLRAASVFYSRPIGAPQVAIVRVPREEVNVWQSDIHASGTLAALLSNVLNSSDTVVGVLLQQPIDTGSGAADVLIEEYLRDAQDSASDKTAKALVDRKYILMDLLLSQRVVIGVERFFFIGQAPLLAASSHAEPLPPWAQAILWPTCVDCFHLEHAVRVARPAVPQHSLIATTAPQFQTVFFGDDDSAYASFFIELLRAVQGVDGAAHLLWDRRRGLAVGELNVPLSPDGSFIPIHSLRGALQPGVTDIPLAEAMARSAFPRVILIAAEGDTQAQVLAQAYYSVRRDRVLYTPWWFAPLSVGMMLIITLYLVCLSTRIPLRWAAIVSLGFCAIIVLTQLGLMYWRNVWLPLAVPLLWLFAGHFLLMVWVIKKQRIRTTVARADKICIERARQFIDGKSLDDAVKQLQGVSAREPLLQTLYDISEAYTQQKDYASAIKVLGAIQKKRRSFRDTEQKLQVLNTMLKSMDEEHAQEHPLQKTQVLDAKAFAPRSLGRYRLEKEIGRGAMGQVYLGFDPRIARRVAIKTLSYEQFKGKDIDDLKARFFREAEAAGRLSHPSIVSVFDVGEEGNRAYIAMDYAEGKALNHFVNASNLLPVFEVYRIICDVAIALEYAHENNIVHRDVKPGNIIYNPVPYQVKVTDFGIARLVDNSKTSTGEILGSPLYMAPEQLKGKKVNRAADIFSLGVTFYQLLTGRLPFEGDNLAALTYEIIHGRHKGVRTVRSDLPTSASRIVNQALQKDPEDRYGTAAEMATVLKKAIRRDFAAQAKKAGYI